MIEIEDILSRNAKLVDHINNSKSWLDIKTTDSIPLLQTSNVERCPPQPPMSIFHTWVWCGIQGGISGIQSNSNAHFQWSWWEPASTNRPTLGILLCDFHRCWRYMGIARSRIRSALWSCRRWQSDAVKCRDTLIWEASYQAIETGVMWIRGGLP